MPGQEQVENLPLIYYYSLTNSGLYPVDPERVIRRLPCKGPQSQTTPPPTVPETPRTPHTPPTQDQFVASLNQLSQYTPTFRHQINTLKKATSKLLAHRTILEHENERLFKANQAKKIKQKKQEEKGSKDTAFGRVLTPAMAQGFRKIEADKQTYEALKESASLIRKSNTLARKLIALVMKYQRM